MCKRTDRPNKHGRVNIELFVLKPKIQLQLFIKHKLTRMRRYTSRGNHIRSFPESFNALLAIKNFRGSIRRQFIGSHGLQVSLIKMVMLSKEKKSFSLTLTVSTGYNAICSITPATEPIQTQ